MATHFLGAELEDFAVGGTVTHSSLASARRAANSRQQCLINIGAEDTCYLENPDAFSATEFWTKWIDGWAGVNSAGASLNIMKWYAGGTQRLALRWLDATTFELRKWNGASWDSLATASSAGYTQPSTNSYFIFDVFIKLGNPGEMRLYVGEVIAINATGLDLTWAGVTAIDKVRLNPNQSNRTQYVSEVIVADWNTLFAKLVTVIPDANGTYTAWAGGGYTQLTETTGNATYIASGTADQRSSFSLAALPALGTDETIAALKVSFSALRDTAGPQNVNAFARVAGADHDGGDQSLGTTVGKRYQMWEASPDTLADWTPTEINASEIGFRSRA